MKGVVAVEGWAGRMGVGKGRRRGAGGERARQTKNDPVLIGAQLSGANRF